MSVGCKTGCPGRLLPGCDCLAALNSPTTFDPAAAATGRGGMPMLPCALCGAPREVDRWCGACDVDDQLAAADAEAQARTAGVDPVTTAQRHLAELAEAARDLDPQVVADTADSLGRRLEGAARVELEIAVWAELAHRPDIAEQHTAAADGILDHLAAMRAEYEARRAFDPPCRHRIRRGAATRLRQLAAAFDRWADR